MEMFEWKMIGNDWIDWKYVELYENVFKIFN